MTTKHLSRCFIPLLTCTLAAASFLVVADRVDAETCNQRTYYANGSGSEPTCSASYDEAVANAVFAIESAYPDCEFLSVSVVGPVGQFWSSGAPPDYTPMCHTSLRVKYVCQVCFNW